MGWLTENLNGKKLFYSDQSIDDCEAFLKRLGEEYRDSELARLPTLNEILLNLEIILGTSLEEYCSDGDNLDLISISAKTQKQPAQPKAKLGDLIAVPFKRDLYGFVQVIELESGGKNGIIGVSPDLSLKLARAGQRPSLEFIAQFQIELTGVAWKHWRVIENLPVDPGLKVQKFSWYLTCFVAELQILDELKAKGLVDREFNLYEDVRAFHSKLRPQIIEKLEITMKFLEEHRLLSQEGLNEIKSGKLPEDFRLHTGLLTKEGRRFYDQVFKKDYQSEHFYTDTYNKLKALWSEIGGK